MPSSDSRSLSHPTLNVGAAFAISRRVERPSHSGGGRPPCPRPQLRAAENHEEETQAVGKARATPGADCPVSYLGEEHDRQMSKLDGVNDPWISGDHRRGLQQAVAGGFITRDTYTLSFWGHPLSP